jgi:Ca2+-binding EF-hand superfamily protein
MSEAVSILTIDARGAEQGSAAYIRAMNAAQKAADRVLDQQEKINQAQGRQMPLMINGANSIERTAKAWNRLQASLDPVIAATKAIEQATLRADAAVRTGVASQVEAARVVDLVRQKHAAALGTLNDNTAAMGKLQKSSGLASHELVNLGRQAQDVFVSLASGQAPLTVLIQQGTQIADVFLSSKGSVTGFFTQVGQAILPFAPLIIAATTALAGLAAAFSVISQRQELSNSLMGIGRAAGLTGDQLNTLAKEAAEAGQVSIATSREIAAEYVRTGKISGPVIRELIKNTRDYAATTQQDIPAAMKELASAFADPLKGFDAINSRLGTLGPSVQKAIRDALAQNDVLRAQTILMQGLASSTTSAAESQGVLTQAWERYKRALSNTVDMAGTAVTNLFDPAKATELNNVLGKRVDIQKRIADAERSGTVNSRKIQTLRDDDARFAKDEERLRKQIDSEKQIAQAQQERVKTADALNKAETASRTYDKDIESIERLKKTVSDLEDGWKKANKAQDEMVDWRKPINEQAEMEGIKRIADYEAKLITARQQLQEFTDAQAAGSLAADKASRAIEIQGKYVGDLDAKQRAALAAELKRNELRGSDLSPQQREREAQNEATSAMLAATRAQAEAAAATKYGMQVNQQATKAIVERGSAYGQAAEIQANAEIKARQAGDATTIAANDTAEALSRVQRERAENNARLTEAAALERTLIAQVNAGKISLAEASRQIRVNSEVQAERNKQVALGVTDQKQLADAQKATTAAVSASLTAEQNRAAAGISDQQRQTIESLEKEIALVGQSTAARRIEYEVLQAKQQLQQAGISLESEEGAAIIERAKRIGELNVRLSEQARLQQQLRQAQDFAADSLKSFVEELLTGTDGINGALKSLGKGFLSASLDALISGKGPLAGLTGLAGTRDQQGGALGILINGLPKAIEKGAEKGAEKGVVGGVIAANDNSVFAGLGINGKDLAGGLTAIAGLAGAYGAGMSAGSYGQAVGAGAVSGGMAGLALAGTGIGATLGGAAVLGPIGLLVGAGLAYWGQKSARDAAKKQREEEAQENYRQAEPGIATLRSQLRGESQDTLEKRIENTLTEVKKGIDVAFFAKKTAEATALADDFGTYKWKAIEDFQRAFAGLIGSLEDGLGPNSAFAQARESVKATGDSLKGFISDAAYAFGKEAAQVDQAREAAKTHALSILDGSKTLSNVATRMEEIRGAGAALQQLLVELGMSASDAADAIQRDTLAALDRLKGAFETDLRAKTNDAQGFGYINDVVTLLKEVSTLKLDAAALGTDPALVTTYFQAAAQGVVDSAQLTGNAFNKLLAQFPDLVGNVSEFTGALKGAAREADIAARALQYQDRLFVATNDNDTLAGQLAAYDRQAWREREAEMKAGGEAIKDLEAALQAERLNIIRDFNQQAIDEQKRVADEVKSFLERLSRQIKEYTDGLRAGSESPLSPQARLAAAQSQYNSQLVLAQGGDRDALNSITSYSTDLLDAAKAYFASSSGYQDIFSGVIDQLEALPDQVTETELIIAAINAGSAATVSALSVLQSTLLSAVQANNPGAIATALGANFALLDTNIDKLLTPAEFIAGLGPLATAAEQQAARAIFASIDANGDGFIDAIETMRAALVSAIEQNSSEAFAAALYGNFSTLDSSINGLIDFNEMKTALGPMATKSEQEAARAIFSAIDADGDGQISKMEAVRAATAPLDNRMSATNTSLLALAQISGATQNTAVLASQINAQAAYTAESAAYIRMNTRLANQANGVAGYREGGHVRGAGTGISDSIPARLSNNEFVFRSAAVDYYGVNTLNQMNDNFRSGALPFAAPAGMGVSGFDDSRVVALLGRLIDRIGVLENRLCMAEREGAEIVSSSVDGVRAEQKKASSEMRQGSNRPRHGKAA